MIQATLLDNIVRNLSVKAEKVRKYSFNFLIDKVFSYQMTFGGRKRYNQLDNFEYLLINFDYFGVKLFQ